MTNFVKKYDVKGCCGKRSIVLETNFPVLKNHYNYFKSLNYNILDNYLKSGMLYIENDDLIGIVSFGSNKINIKCKQDCDNAIDILQNQITNMG